jgi:predicted ATPase/DNA-binding SARP family transcriptional activator
VEFRILGSIEADDDGLALDLGGMRERTLLARLLLSANRVVSADRLAEDLWAGDPPPHSMATLRVYISRLRRALGPQASALLTRAPGYRLNVDDDQLDAARFDRLVRAADADMAAGRPEAAAMALREALDLWRGPALADVADLAFARADASRLEEGRLTALENRVEADLACGRHASLIAELDGLAASHPLRERLTGQRILALYRCGRQADALRAHAELRARLAEELGIDPSPDLRRMQERILRQDPALDWQPRGASVLAGGAAVPGQAGGAAASGHAADSTASGQAGDTALGNADGTSGGTGASDGTGGLEQMLRRPDAAAVPGLPTETTSFIGREAELNTIEELLRLSRLVTLTGPGGSGKSRLALRSAAQASGQYADGVWLVELAPINRPGLVVPAIALALSTREEPGRTLLESLTARLRDSEALLVVDNCEHVIDAAAEVIATLLRNCRRLRILATSQTRLSVSGEATWPVPPLTVPRPDVQDPQAAAGAESVRLFCDRAAFARPGFALNTANAAAVSDICRQLDGIPLAIELAAARVSALTAAQLSARLDNRFRLLTGGNRAGLPRHRTLQAAIEWSHDLLSETEQVCFRRMAVFSGGCTIDAVEAVCPDPALPLDVVFETVTALVDRSLLTIEERFGSMRYGMLESIHQYALGRLAEAGEDAEFRRRQLSWLVGFAGQAKLDGPDQGAWLDLLEAELDNFRAGLEWSLAPPDRNPDADPALALTMAGALSPFWMVRGPVAVGRSVLTATLAAAGPQADRRLRAVALDGAGQLASVQGDQDAQRAYQQESLAIWRELGDDARTVSCLGDLGAVAHVRGDYPAARSMYTEALELAGRAGDAQQMARALSGLGRLALHQGNLEQATAYYTESMARFREVGDLRRATLILGNLGVVATNLGDLDLAQQRLEEHLGNAKLLGDRKLTGGALTNLGLVAYHAGDMDSAAELHQQALELAEQVGDRRLASVAITNLGMVAARQKDYAAAAQFHLRSLDLAEAVGERRSIAESLEELAGVESAAGHAGRAATLFGASQALREDIGAPIPAPDLARFNEAAATAVAALGDEAFKAAHGAGQAMSVEQAAAFARAGSPLGRLPGQERTAVSARGGSNDFATPLQPPRTTIGPSHPAFQEARHEGAQRVQPKREDHRRGRDPAAHRTLRIPLVPRRRTQCHRGRTDLRRWELQRQRTLGTRLVLQRRRAHCADRAARRACHQPVHDR